MRRKTSSDTREGRTTAWGDEIYAKGRVVISHPQGLGSYALANRMYGAPPVEKPIDTGDYRRPQTTEQHEQQKFEEVVAKIAEMATQTVVEV